MAIMQRMLRPFLERRGMEQTFVSDPAAWLIAMFGGGRSTSGALINESSAMELPAFFSGVSAVSETLGSLSLKVFQDLNGAGKAEAKTHPLYERLHLNPNPECTTMNWREMKQAHLLMQGNAYSEIVWTPTGAVEALWPIHPNRVRPVRKGEDLWYLVTAPANSVSSPAGKPLHPEKEYALHSTNMLHIRGISLDGIYGISRLTAHAESLGLSLDLQEFGARFFANGAVPGGVLEHPQRLGDKARENLRESWERLHTGLPQSHRLAILEEGMKWHETGVQNEKAQFLESRQFQVGEAARTLRVPGLIVGHDDKTSTYASAEQFFLSYVVHTVRPWVVRWEQQMSLSLLSRRERANGLFVMFNVDSLLRGDAAARADSNEKQWRSGALNIDEWRDREGLNPLPNGQGKRFFIPVNFVPLDKVDEMLAKQTPAPTAKEPSSEPAPKRWDLLATMLHDTAVRSLRREVDTLTREHKAHPTAEGWRDAVDEFYARHVLYLAEVFHCPLDAARFYTDHHRAQCLADGVNATTRWGPETLAEMMTLPMEAAANGHG